MVEVKKTRKRAVTPRPPKRLLGQKPHPPQPKGSKANSKKKKNDLDMAVEEEEEKVHDKANQARVDPKLLQIDGLYSVKDVEVRKEKAFRKLPPIVKTTLVNEDEILYAAKGFRNGGIVARKDVKKSPYKLPKQFTPDQIIDEGNFGKVYWVDGIIDNRAVKVITEPQDAKELFTEMAALQAVRSEHVVKFYGYQYQEGIGVDEKELRMVMEKVETLKRLGEGTFKPNVLAIAKCAALGLDAVHSAGLLHNDFAARNVFMTSKTQAKVGDFGLVVSYDRNGWGPMRAQCWPLDIAAPEVVLNFNTLCRVNPEHFDEFCHRHSSLKSDVYSFGMFLCELHFNQLNLVGSLASRVTFESLEVLKLQPELLLTYLAAQAEKKDMPDGPYRDLVIECIDRDPMRRPIMAAVIEKLDVISPSSAKKKETRKKSSDSMVKVRKLPSNKAGTKQKAASKKLAAAVRKKGWLLDTKYRHLCIVQQRVFYMGGTRCRTPTRISILERHAHHHGSCRVTRSVGIDNDLY